MDNHELLKAHKKQNYRSWQQFADEFGVSRAALWYLSRGDYSHLSLDKRNAVWHAIGAPTEAPPPIPVPPCPTCGQVHALHDCHGARVQHVRRRSRPRRWRDMPTHAVARAIRERVEV